MEKKKHPAIKSNNYDKRKEGIEYEAYEELVENGLNDNEIATELNISEDFLKSIKKQINEP